MLDSSVAEIEMDFLLDRSLSKQNILKRPTPNCLFIIAAKQKKSHSTSMLKLLKYAKVTEKSSLRQGLSALVKKSDF